MLHIWEDLSSNLILSWIFSAIPVKSHHRTSKTVTTASFRIHSNLTFKNHATFRRHISYVDKKRY